MNTPQTPSKFLLAILEGFLDGILVVTPAQHLLYLNNPAHRICQRLLDLSTQTIPPEIWQLCAAMLERHTTHPEPSIGMEADVPCGDRILHVRVQWLIVEGYDQPCFLVRLQDPQEAMTTLAIAEAQNWQLTERETQVWSLRRTGLRRKQIATELYISEDTVKKHLGNIRAKRQSYLDEVEWQQQNPTKRYSA